MGEGKRLGWIDGGKSGGFDQVDRIQKDDLRSRLARETDVTLKERKRVQDDEQKSINIHSEGVCYKCHKFDYILSSLFLVCMECIEKHGDEAILNIVTTPKHMWELCDFHEKWVFHEVCQINCSLCNTCLRRVKLLHRAYKKSGGRKKNSPDVIKLRKIYGKDYNYLLGQVNPTKQFKMKRS